MAKSAWSIFKAKQWAKVGMQKIPKLRPWTTRPYLTRSLERGIHGIPDERCFVLQNVMFALRNVPGDVAECGVRFGKSTAFLYDADASGGMGGRAFCLFDSFEGLSEPQKEDLVPGQDKAAWVKHELSVPEQTVRKNLADLQNVHYFKGWIPDRFPDVAERTFALLHVDVDLYQPTRDALEFFWPRLSPGGMVVCDDYGSAKCPGAKRALDEFFADGRGGLMELPTMQAIAIKPA